MLPGFFFYRHQETKTVERVLNVLSAQSKVDRDHQDTLSLECGK